MVALLVFVFGSAILDWIATFKAWSKVEMFAKPAAMIFLFAWLYAGTRLMALCCGSESGLYFIARDTLLLSPDRFFLPGLIAFLLAHVAYIIGLSIHAAPANIWDILFAFMILLSAVRDFAKIDPRLEIERNEQLNPACGDYALTISIMLFFAVADTR